MDLLLRKLVVHIILITTACSIYNGQAYSQCQISTYAGSNCTEVIVSTTAGATYTALGSNGRKTGSGQGNGGSISLMQLTNGGAYRIIGQKNNCIEISDNVVGPDLASIQQQIVSTSGSICNGSGVVITLANSQSFVSYQLTNGSILQTVQGTNGPISFDTVRNGGTYTIIGKGPGCIQSSAEVAVAIIGDGTNAAPIPYFEGFNPNNDATISGCWSRQFISGASEFLFPVSSANPATTPHEGSRYLLWNSSSSSNPAGNQTRLVSAPITTSKSGAVDVEFYWYNNNNPLFSSGNYLNEGVQVQYSFDGINWTDAGPFVGRHDASLAPGTGAWKLKKISLPYVACRKQKVFIGLKFRSEHGENCSLDNFSIKASDQCVFNVAAAPMISECQNVTTYGTQNFSDFSGIYPNNSVGFDAFGAESLFRFIPSSTGVYYVDGIDENSSTAVFIKPASAGCSLLGWDGVSNNNMPAKRALGLLQAGIEYYILVDGTATFKVCKAGVANPTPNSCFDAIPFAGLITAGTTKKEYLLDRFGNLIAELDLSAVQNSLNVIKASYYVNNGAIRRDNGNKEYLDRNFTLNGKFTGTIRIKLFFATNELQKLIDEPNDGLGDVNGLDDLKVSRTFQGCGPADAGGISALFNQSQSNNLGGNVSYIEFSETLNSTDPTIRTYFIHGGNQPLNAQCQAPFTATISGCEPNSLSIFPSELNSSYTLVRKSDSLILGTLQGNGNSLEFQDLITNSDVYYLKVEKPGCPTTIMGQKFYQTSYPLLQNLVGGILCNGVSQSLISLSNSEKGFKYFLSRNGFPMGIEAMGTGSAIQFGTITQGGTYTVLGYNPNATCGYRTVASIVIDNSMKIPLVESFNTSGNQVSLSCWSTQYVMGTSDIYLETQSPTPYANPVEGSRMVTWKSYDNTHPAGNETRLVSLPIQTLNAASVDLEFYWFNNNNPSYSSGNYLNEGVEVQYSIDGTNWISFGAYFPRHDGSITSGEGKWKKKRVTLPAAFGNKLSVYLGFKFHSEFGDNCNLDAVSLIVTPTCSPVTGLDTNSTSANKVKFQWNAAPGVLGYEYAVTSSAISPPQGIRTTINSGMSPDLNSETSYFIHVRKQCGAGIFSSWETLPVITKPGPVNCETAEAITLCSETTVSIPEGEGSWNFAGAYPLNSVGFATPGKERIFSFTPSTSGVYYLDVTSGDKYVDYFYKPASAGCGNTGWIGIDDFIGNWRKAIGFLQANTTYLILADNEETTATTQKFKICLATVANPLTLNDCNGVYWFPGSVPANSPKEEFAIDDQGNLLAALDFSEVNNAVGDLIIYYRVNNQATRRDSLSREYLDRDFTIWSTVKPSGKVKVKLFFKPDEITKLINEPNDGIADVATTNDLNVSVIEQDCSPFAFKQAFVSSQTPSNMVGTPVNPVPLHIQFNTPLLGSFYLHGGSNALNQKNGTTNICPGTISSFIMTQQGYGYYYQWEVDKGSGYESIADNQVYSGANANTLFLKSPAADYDGYKYRCIASGPSGVIIGQPQTLRIVLTWQGTAGSAWENPSNWSCGIVPDENSNIVIPAGVTNMPVLNSNVTVRSITVEAGATLIVGTGYKLELKGK